MILTVTRQDPPALNKDFIGFGAATTADSVSVPIDFLFCIIDMWNAVQGNA